MPFKTNCLAVHALPNYEKELSCRLLVPWKTSYPRFPSMAFAKRSPLMKFFAFQQIRMINEGTMARIANSWDTVRQGCEEDKVNKITMF